MSLYRCSGGGTTTTIDGVVVDEDLNLVTKGSLIYEKHASACGNTIYGMAECKNKLYIITGGNFGMWNGTAYVKLADIHGSYSYPRIVTLNEEIHAFFCDESEQHLFKHYRWNGSEFVYIGEMPYGYISKALVCNDEIHIFGNHGSGGQKHYKWNETDNSWSSVSTLPWYSYLTNSVYVVYRNEIHALGGYAYDYTQEEKCKFHYKWDGTQWVSVSTLPISTPSGGSACTCFDSIYLFTGKKHYKFTGSSWSLVNSDKWDGAAQSSSSYAVCCSNGVFMSSSYDLYLIERLGLERSA